MNSFGPKTEPRGIPHISGMAADSRSLTRMTCVRPFRKSTSHSRASPWTPKRRSKTSLRIGGSTVSNAADRSSSIRAPTCPSLIKDLYNAIEDACHRCLSRVERAIGRLESREQVVGGCVTRESGVHDLFHDL